MPAGCRAPPRTECRCSCRNSASSPPRSKTNGSPRFSRATSLPSRAFSASRQLIASCAIGCGAALPTSISSAPGRACLSSRGGTSVIVNDDVGAAQAFEAVHGDEAGIARAGADQIDGRILHGCMAFHGRRARAATSARISSAPRASSCSATRAARRRSGSRTEPVASARAPSRAVQRNHDRRRCAPSSPATSRVRADRHLAPAAQSRRRPRARPSSAARAVGIVDASSPARVHASSSLANFDRDDALTRRRHADVRSAAPPRCARACSRRLRPAAARTSAS